MDEELHPEDGNVAPQDFVQSLDCIIWSSEPSIFVGLRFLHLSHSLEKQAPNSIPYVIFSMWQVSREGKEIENIEKEKQNVHNAITLLQIMLTFW